MRDYEWLFDTSGYYTYISLCGTKDTFDRIQNQLSEAGFLIYKSGHSIRPAGNGRQYDWYIRLQAEDSDYPRIRRIMNRPSAATSQQRYTPGPPTSNYTPSKTAHVKDNDDDTVTFTDRQIEEIKQFISDNFVRIEKLEEIQTLLDRERQKVKDLEKGARSEKTEWEQVLLDENTELEQKIDRKNNEIIELKNQLAQEAHDRSELLEQINQQNRIDKNTSKNTGFDLFVITLDLFAPNLEFLGGSIERLWNEIESPISLLKEISRLDQPTSKGEHVEGVNGWLKTNKGKWRLYYEASSESGKRRIFIGDKNSQKSNIEWLKQQ